jgi:hypothetical protein
MLKYSIADFHITDRHMQVSKYWRDKVGDRSFYFRYQLDHKYDESKTKLIRITLTTDIVWFIPDSIDEQLYFQASTVFETDHDDTKFGTRDTYELVKEHFKLVNQKVNSTKILNDKTGLRIEGFEINPAGDGYAMAENLANMMNEIKKIDR